MHLGVLNLYEALLLSLLHLLIGSLFYAYSSVMLMFNFRSLGCALVVIPEELPASIDASLDAFVSSFLPEFSRTL